MIQTPSIIDPEMINVVDSHMITKTSEKGDQIENCEMLNNKEN